MWIRSATGHICHQHKSFCLVSRKRRYCELLVIYHISVYWAKATATLRLPTSSTNTMPKWKYCIVHNQPSNNRAESNQADWLDPPPKDQTTVPLWTKNCSGSMVFLLRSGWHHTWSWWHRSSPMPPRRVTMTVETGPKECGMLGLSRDV